MNINTIKVFFVSLLFCGLTFSQNNSPKTIKVPNEAQIQNALKNLLNTIQSSQRPQNVSLNIQSVKTQLLSDASLIGSKMEVQNVEIIAYTSINQIIYNPLSAFFKNQYKDVLSSSLDNWVNSLMKNLEQSSLTICSIKWQVIISGQSRQLESFGIVNNKGKLIYEKILSGFLTNVSNKISKQPLSTNSAGMSTASFNSSNSNSISGYTTVTNLLQTGTVEVHWTVTASAEVAPYISSQTNDGTLTVTANVSCSTANPTGIPPPVYPNVIFGSGGTLGDKTKPYGSAIGISGTVDHFNTGSYSLQMNDQQNSPWNVSFSVSYDNVGISISPPTDNSVPLILTPGDQNGRLISLLDEVYLPSIFTTTYRGVFANGGTLNLSNFVVRVENGGTEVGGCFLNLPIYGGYTDQLGDISASYIGTIPLNVQYVRGDEIPNPQINMTASLYSLNINQQSKITVKVTNPSTVVSMQNGSVNLIASSLGSTLSIVGSATQNLGTIAPGGYQYYYFYVKGVNGGTVRPQVNVSGGWGWPASNAGKTFNIPASLDNNIQVIPNVQITIQTVPSGRNITADGQTFTAPQTFSWGAGSSHSIGTTSLQSGGTGIQYTWSNWSDGGSINHNITVPNYAATYTANFNTQYYLIMSANLSNGGTVSPQSGWHNSGDQVQIQATENSGYYFNGWTGNGSGSYTGPNNPNLIYINGPIQETAGFSTNPTTTVTTDPAGRSITVDGQNYTAPQSFSWTPGLNHTIATTSTQDGGSDTQFVWNNWSDGGALSHTITAPSSNATYTANFTTQYYLTVNSDHGSAKGSGWYEKGKIAYASLNDKTFSGETGIQYVFSSWGTDASGSNYAQSNAITMNGPKTATANFKTQYYLTMITPSNGTVSPPTGSYYDSAKSVSISAIANEGYTFDGWSGSGTVSYSGAKDSVSITMNSPITETANFSKVSSVKGFDNSVVKTYAILQNFPNPFNPTTTINYEVPKTSLVIIKLYNILGKEVTTLVNEEKPQGRYSVQFSADTYHLTSGIYFYRMQAGDFVATKKLVLMK